MYASKCAPERWWASYLKGTLFLIPPIFIWAIVAIFVAPKVKQIWADAGIVNPSHWTFGSMDFIRANVLWLTAVVIAIIVACEKLIPAWEKFRRLSVAGAVVVINTAILVSVTLLLITAIEVTLNTPRVQAAIQARAQSPN